MTRFCRIASIIIVAGLLFVGVSTSVAGAEIKSTFDLPAEPLDKALRDFAVQANCNISYEPSLVAGLQAPAIKGEFSPASALSMMLAGTRLVAVNINEDTIQVVAAPAVKSQNVPLPAEGPGHGVEIRHIAYAMADGTDAQSVSPNSPNDESNPETKNHENKDLQEITVTGTHIRGTTDSPSPVEIYSRADIDATGANTVQQFLQTLPQNFNGGASENTLNQITGGGQTNNAVSGSAPNLRGLGADATLVLINGHRVAPGDIDGSFVDVSMIPLTAIERVEVVTDGASAIYGSDAVGGVVNFILRTHFDGAESRVQYGTASENSTHNVQAGQTVGKEWTGGSAVLSYQYFDQTPLSAGSRSYLPGVMLPFYLLPQQIEHAAFANITQELTSGLDLHGDLLYSHRSTNTVYSDEYGAGTDMTVTNPARIDGYSASFGGTLKLPRASEFGISTTYSESDTDQQVYQTPSAAPFLNGFRTKSSIISLDANLDGVLASLPAGPIRYAIGGQYRREYFGNTYYYPSTDNTFYPNRRVGAGYGELRVPVLGGSGHGGPALELTLADREEHFSDFGSTNNPQFGVIWKPLEGVVARGTYGTSFKAPLLSELNPLPFEVALAPGSFYNSQPGGPPSPNTLNVFGGNPALKPEKATVWTVGLDFKPAQLPGFNAKFTYYNIVFKDQINAASSSICSCDIFLDEAILGPSIVQRNPPAASVEQLISLPTFVNFLNSESPQNINPATVGAIFDSRYLNLSTVKTSGLDYRLAYKMPVLGAQLETGLNGTYIFRFDDQFTSSAPAVSILNTTFYPTNLRLRGREVLTFGPLTAGLYLNFTNAYTNNAVLPVEHVSSWTTADVVASYQFGTRTEPLSGFVIGVSVTNLANRNPPFVSNPLGYGINYDGANANALGRYISIRLQKRW